MVFAAHFFYASLRMPMYAPKWVNKSEKMNDEPVHLGPNLINLQTTSNIKPKWHTKNYKIQSVYQK